MPEYLLQTAALPPAVVRELEVACESSPLLGKSPLAGTFENSRGFAATWKHDGLATLLTRHPFLRPFLEVALAPDVHRALWPATARLRRSFCRAPNAFYLNLLKLEAGAEVGPHVDTTLREASGQNDAMAGLVSVLYLAAPEGPGGELVLSRKGRQVLVFRPEPGTLLRFRGDLTHEVRRLGSGRRLSLVCEHYHLRRAALRRLPALKVHSRELFKNVLAAQRDKPLPDFVLD